MNAVRGRNAFSLASVFALGVAALGLGTGAWGQQGGSQGPIGRRSGSVEAIQQGLDQYLNGDETDSVLTPGESVEYALNLKAGQVVIGEARSDAFDPALEIVDAKGKVLVGNDDRYPGDQRPLVLWRCDVDGEYKARVRCFRDRAGGQVFTRLKTFETLDASGPGAVEKELAGGTQFLVRVPLKAGQVKEELSNVGGRGGYLPFNYNAVIAPGGLPDIGLALRLQPAIYALLAPVDGEYYIAHTTGGDSRTRRNVRVEMREVVPAKPVREGSALSTSAPTNVPGLTELTVKQGDLLRVAAPELNIDARLLLAEVPDVSKYNVAKPETNPFFPHPDAEANAGGPAFDLLPGRSGDGRLINFRARRDAKLWVATNAAGPGDRTFTLKVGPAARELAEGSELVGKLRIADYDHWAFEAKPGDVMTFRVGAPEFRAVTVVRDPNLAEIRHEAMELDQATDTWRLIVQTPGRYVLTVSALGEGGGGAYSVSRRTFQAKTFGKSTPAKGEISANEVQVWKFTAQPHDPLLVHWRSTHWNYDVAIYDDQGRPANFQRQPIDANNQYGILTASEPRTYVIVLTGRGEKASYSIDLEGIPGRG